MGEKSSNRTDCLEYRNENTGLWGKIARLPVGWLAVALGVFAAGQQAQAQPIKALEYYGGPVLERFTDAIWRPGSQDEVAIHDATFATYMTRYNILEPQGYRLYILETVVLSSGDLRYNAVWQKGVVDRPL